MRRTKSDSTTPLLQVLRGNLRVTTAVAAALLILIFSMPVAPAAPGNLEVSQHSRKLATPADDELADQGDHYLLADGTKVQLLRSKTEVAVGYKKEADAEAAANEVRASGEGARLTSLASARFGSKAKTDLFKSVDKQRNIDRQALQNLPSVAFVYPVLVDANSHTRMVPTDELLISFQMALTLEEAKAVAATYAVEIVEPTGSKRMNVYLARLTDAKTADPLSVSRQLAANPKVRWAQPNFVREFQSFAPPDDTLFPRQQNLHNTGQNGGVTDADIDAPEAWDVTVGNVGVVIAIIDDGVDTAHTDLRIYTNQGESGGGKETNGLDDDGNGRIDDVHGWDFANGDNNPSPAGSNGHGTGTAGVAAAIGNNASRVAGTAHGCTVLPVKIANDSGVFTTDQNIGNAISYAADYADILSNSWGGGAPSAFINAAIDDAVTNGRGGRGSPVFFASGNSASRWMNGGGRFRFNVGTDLGAGTFSFGFRFSTDAAGIAGENLVKIDNVVLLDGDNYTHLTSGLGVAGRQDFEGVFPPAGWTRTSSSGVNFWFITLANPFTGTAGTRSPQSGAIAASQWTELRTPNLTLQGDEVLAFAAYLSCAAGDGLTIRIYNSAGTFLGAYTSSGLPISGNPTINTAVAYPANYVNSIAVGASTDSDRRSDYSEFGTGLDFVGPSNGGWNDIATLDPNGAVGWTATDVKMNFGGTSSACPVAAGIGALLVSRNPLLTAAQIRTVMRNTCDKVGGVVYDGAGFNQFYGFGRVNANAALAFIDAPPVVQVPGSQTTPEDANLTINGISVTDPDIGGLNMRVQLSASASSTLTLSTTAGITVTAGANASSAMTFQGTLASVNAALSGLVYRRTIDGSDTITVAATDIGNTGFPGPYTDTKTIPVTVTFVNDFPVVSFIPNQTMFEDTTLVVNFTVSDEETPADQLFVSATTWYEVLVPQQNLVVGGAGANRSVSITPALNMNSPAGPFGAAGIFIVADEPGQGGGRFFYVTVVEPVNDAPAFAKGNDLVVLQTAGAQSVGSWATQISPGPTSDETSQALNFVVGNNNASLFSAPPAISANGTLTFTPAAAANGSATVTVQLHDNGGTANGGVDTSLAQTFAINVTPYSVSIAANDPNAEEADSASNNGQFTVTRSGGNNSQALTVFYSVTGTASGGTDYTSLPGSVIIPANQSSAVIDVIVSNDSNYEWNETVTLTLSANTAYVIGAGNTATVTIYSFFDLGVLPTGTSSRGFGLNDSGRAVGYSDASGTKAFRTSANQAIGAADDLHPAISQLFGSPGLGTSVAWDISSGDHSVGEWTYNGVTKAWCRGSCSGSTVLQPIAYSGATANYIRSVIDWSAGAEGAGFSTINGMDRFCHWYIYDCTPNYTYAYNIGASIWPSLHSYGMGIAPNRAVGFVAYPTGNKAFLWDWSYSSSGPTYLVGPSGTTPTEAYDIVQYYSYYYVVGVSEAASLKTACYWAYSGYNASGVQATLLPKPAGWNHSVAQAINSNNRVAGNYFQSYTPADTDRRASVWESGTLVILNNVVPGDAGWVLNSSEKINSWGHVIGYGSVGGQFHAFRIKP
jgi:subtilisin family serine protease